MALYNVNDGFINGTIELSFEEAAGVWAEYVSE